MTIDGRVGVGTLPKSSSATLSLREIRRELASEYRTLTSLVRANRMQHRRALYMQRVLDVHRQLRLALSASEGSEIQAGCVEPALAAAERALERIPPAWLKLRDLIAQTYFIPFALCHLALLSRSASLLSQLHFVLCTSGNATQVSRKLPCLLALHRPPISEEGSLLTRFFGSSVPSQNQHPTACAVLTPMVCHPAAPNLRMSAVVGSASEDEDMGEGVPEEGVEKGMGAVVPVEGEATGLREDLGEDAGVDLGRRMEGMPRGGDGEHPLQHIGESGELRGRGAMVGKDGGSGPGGDTGTVVGPDALFKEAWGEVQEKGQEESIVGAESKEAAVVCDGPGATNNGELTVESSLMDVDDLWELDPVGDADPKVAHCTEACAEDGGVHMNMDRSEGVVELSTNAVGEATTHLSFEAAVGIESGARPKRVPRSSRAHVQAQAPSFQAPRPRARQSSKGQVISSHPPAQARVTWRRRDGGYRQLLATASLLRRHVRY